MQQTFSVLESNEIVPSNRAQLAYLVGIELICDILECFGHFAMKRVTTLLEVRNSRHNIRVDWYGVFPFT